MTDIRELSDHQLNLAAEVVRSQNEDGLVDAALHTEASNAGLNVAYLIDIAPELQEVLDEHFPDPEDEG